MQTSQKTREEAGKLGRNGKDPKREAKTQGLRRPTGRLDGEGVSWWSGTVLELRMTDCRVKYVVQDTGRYTGDEVAEWMAEAHMLMTGNRGL